MKLIYKDMLASCEKYGIKVSPAIGRLLRRMESCKRINNPDGPVLDLYENNCDCFLCLQLRVQALMIDIAPIKK